MKKHKIIVLIIAVAFVAIQLAPVKRDNPAGQDTFNAPADVKQIVERSCYDCHSNKSRWPWYSHVAPVSWAVSSDVHEARKKMNFSNWGNLTAKKQQAKREEIIEEVESNGMPLPKYLIIHRDARLSEKEKQILYKWAKSKGGF